MGCDYFVNTGLRVEFKTGEKSRYLELSRQRMYYLPFYTDDSDASDNERCADAYYEEQLERYKKPDKVLYTDEDDWTTDYIEEKYAAFVSRHVSDLSTIKSITKTTDVYERG